MAATIEEVSILRNRLVSKHGIELYRIATMMDFFVQMSPAAPQKADHVQVLHDIVNAHLKAKGISRAAFAELLIDLDRTYTTLSILSSLPD